MQASAFTSKEEEGYDIAGDYWLGDAAEEGGGEIQKLSIARYNEHARNRLHSNIMNVGHYGVARIKNNTLKWGATVQLEKINDKISEWEKRDSAGYSLPARGRECQRDRKPVLRITNWKAHVFPAICRMYSSFVPNKDCSRWLVVYAAAIGVITGNLYSARVLQ